MSAGRPQKFEYEGNSTKVKLDARNSFDPSGQTLTYQWYSTDASNNETAIAGANSAISVITIDNLSGKEKRTFTVKVVSSDGREGSSFVHYKFFPDLEPVIIAPRF